MITAELLSMEAGKAPSPERVEARAQWLPIRRHREVLSTREWQVAAMAASGLRNREIGARLGITEGTVKVHLHNVFDKLHLRTRVELALRAHDGHLG